MDEELNKLFWTISSNPYLNNYLSSNTEKLELNTLRWKKKVEGKSNLEQLKNLNLDGMELNLIEKIFNFISYNDSYVETYQPEETLEFILESDIGKELPKNLLENLVTLTHK